MTDLRFERIEINKIAVAMILLVTGIAAGYFWHFKQTENLRMQIKAEMQEAADSLKELREENERLNKKFMTKTFIATAYCNSHICINVSKWQDGRTATGTVARIGVVAVDPAVIPLGSEVYIEGMGWFKAEDTGGKIKGNRIDIFMGNYKKAKGFGKRVVIVTFAAPQRKEG